VSSAGPLDQRPSVATSNGFDHFGLSARPDNRSARAALDAAAFPSSPEVTLFCAPASFSALEHFDPLCQATYARQVFSLRLLFKRTRAPGLSLA
jgi:hypothetical protein